MYHKLKIIDQYGTYDEEDESRLTAKERKKYLLMPITFHQKINK